MSKKRIIIISIIVGALAVIAVVLYFILQHEPEQRKYEVSKAELSTLKKEVSISIQRYEKDLFTLNTKDLKELGRAISQLSKKYPKELIAAGVWEDPMMMQQLSNYLNDPAIRDIYESTMKVFPDLNDLTDELQDPLAYYLHYYPNVEIPVFFTLVPGIDTESPSVFGYENHIFIHLDMYMGADSPHYKKIGIPLYISERFDKKYIAIDCFKKALVYKHLPEQTRITLLDHMIYEGKKLYFTELMFPKRTEEDLIGYTPEKYAWANQYQPEIWNYLIEKEMLFSKNEDARRKFIEEAPFTKPFTNASPGRLGAFIGWKIVQGYMENHTELSLNDLIKNTDSQMILKESGYKPLKK